MENENTIFEEIEENETFEEVEEIEEVEKKSKWSLKKKLIIGASVVVGLILGAVALSPKKTNAEQMIDDSDNEPQDDNDTEAIDSDDEKPESETTETTEEQ